MTSPDSPPFRQMETARGVRERRLERRIAKARAKAALAVVDETAKRTRPDVADSLSTLRKGLDAQMPTKVGTLVPDAREQRLSAEALLHHHREVAKMGEAKGAVNIGAVQFNVNAYQGLLQNPETRHIGAEMLKALDAPPPPRPE